MAWIIEIPLNFFRRGMLDVYERNYIEAIYDFYFILETVFGEGRFKTAAVSTAFLNSAQLRSCVQRAITDPGPMIMLDTRTRGLFAQSYGTMGVEDAIAKMIQLRGRCETPSDRMRSVHVVPNLAKSLIVVAQRAFRPLQQARLCCKDSLHGSDLLAVSERAAEANLHASGRKQRLRRSSTTGVV